MNSRLSSTQHVSSPRSAASRVLGYALPSLLVAGGVGALGVLRSRWQESRTFLPTRYPTGIWDPSHFGLSVEDAWFEAEDGTALHGWWIEHPKSRATVIYCHGNTGSIADRIGIFRELRRLKINIFAFDYRGYGRSTGEPSERGVYQDVRAAYDYVAGTRRKDPREILLFGHSLGGAVAIDGALGRQVAGLVVQSSFTDLRSMARHCYRSSPLPLFTKNAFKSIEKIGQVEVPKLFVHGTADATVPFAMGEQLYAAAAEPKTWLAVEGAAHNDVYQHQSFRYFRTLDRFRQRCVS